MARILTGIQSSGKPHLGNILGAIEPAIKLSNEKKKFASRIGFLSDEKLQVAKLQNTNKEILDIALKSKV